MSEAADKTIMRVEIDLFDSGNDRERICLNELIQYETSDPEVRNKRDFLLNRMSGEFVSKTSVLKCTVGNCERTFIQDSELGNTVNGDCAAKSYCLNQRFKESESDVEVYKEIMDTCERVSSKYSSGNFCPKLDCDLSAGFSIDGVPGTSGECLVEIRPPQAQLFTDIDS